MQLWRWSLFTDWSLCRCGGGPVHGLVPVQLWRWPLLTGWSSCSAGRNSVERAHREERAAKPYVVPRLGTSMETVALWVCWQGHVAHCRGSRS